MFAFPESVKTELRRISAEHGYVIASEVLARGADEELVLESMQEAQVVVNVARVEMMMALLCCPFWDEDHPHYDPVHAERFDEVVNGLFEKTVSYIAQEFDVVTKI